MPDQMNIDLEFEQLIASFSPPEQFLARQIKSVQEKAHSTSTCPNLVEFKRTENEVEQLAKDVERLDKRKPPVARTSLKRELGLIGAFSAGIVALFEAIARIFKP